MPVRPTSSPSRRRPRATALLTCLAVGLLAPPAVSSLLPAPAAAGGIPWPETVVQTTEDVVAADGLLSLREAVDQANGDGIPNQIVLADGATYVLDECGGGTDENLNVGGDLDHTEDQHIIFVGDAGTTIEQTCPNERVLHGWDPSAILFVQGVRITGGVTTSAGGGVLGGGHVGLERAVIEGNRASGPGGGGGVAANLSVSVVASTVRDNVTAGRGGGVRAYEDVTVYDSTVQGNRANLEGGGVHAGVDVHSISSTITGNSSATAGGGLASSSHDVVLRASTVVANLAHDGANLQADDEISLDGSVVALGAIGGDCLAGDPIVHQGGTVGFDSSCGAAAGDDVADLHPMLGLIEDDGALRPTVGSPSVDRYPGPCLEGEDQLGAERPAGPACDAGAVELSPAACAPTFDDVGAGHPFFSEICWLADSGITGGYQDGSFGAGQAVSRQAMAAFLYRLALEPPVVDLNPAFPDVPADHPFGREIAWLADMEISTGYEDGTFRPGDAVTRQAMAAFLHRVAGEPAVPLPAVPEFSDVPLDHPFVAPIQWMSDAGVSTGYEDGSWHPGAAVTRQAMAAFLQRMAQDVVLAGL